MGQRVKGSNPYERIYPNELKAEFFSIDWEYFIQLMMSFHNLIFYLKYNVGDRLYWIIDCSRLDKVEMEQLLLGFIIFLIDRRS